VDISLYNYKGSRAYQSRLAKSLKPWVIVFRILTFILAFFGVLLVAFGLAEGWIGVGLSAIPLMVAVYYTRQLSSEKIVQGGTRIDELLDTEILALLPQQPSPKDIATAIGHSVGGNFFAARFGIGGGFLEQLVSDNREDTSAVFLGALNNATRIGGGVNAGTLILALVQTIPGKDTLLGHLQITEDDLLNGAIWYHRLENLIAWQSAQPQSGGIGRDWSFGWIPTLSQFGLNLSTVRIAPSDTRQDIENGLIDSLAGKRGTIALVGPTGSGKTEIVYNLASALMNPTDAIPRELHYKQVFMLDASRLLSVVNGRGSLEELISTLLGEAYAAKNIIICLDNAQLFFEEGVGSVDISNLLLPILTAGRLQIILAMDEQRYLQIGARLPELRAGIQRVSIPPTNEAESLVIMQDKLPQLEHRLGVTYMYQALREAYRLSARYVYDIAMPGQAISLLQSAAEHADQKLVTAESVQKAIEKTTGVKAIAVNDEEERTKLLNLETLIHQRMIGQDRAVGVVSDALRRARAGVRNQQRPVGTFLFLGPTGVGKTELAKSLAATYYGGEDAIIRLDMNEYVRPEDVMRLIADGTRDASSLAAQVMKKPFSVVLLDELEKAHSAVLTTLLQLLDEGVLRDETNREVSFRDTIVIATSNAGAHRIQEYIERGYQLEQFEDQFINELITSNIFHPEFLNRFDEMVVFRPLTKPELLQVVDLILVSVNKNLVAQKIAVVVSDEAKNYLVEAGYDPRLGARPMRRVVQRAVESTVAKQLLEQKVTPGGTITIDLQQVQDILDRTNRAEQIILPQAS
jgi:ATP-dependent Clp protease ATP-binding subunit ClpA